MSFLQSLWLIPLFPLAGAAAMFFFGRLLDSTDLTHEQQQARRRVISLLCCGAVALSFVWSVGAVSEVRALPEHRFETVAFSWIAGLPAHASDGRVFSFRADCGFLLDPLSSVMILVVSGIGFLIHVYSTGYMSHDGGYYRFFGSLNLFVFFMLVLVLANNYVMVFTGWEGVGLCSYLLIGFYFDRQSAGDAAKKAFLVNRVGDAGFILGILLLFATLGTSQFTAVREILSSGRFAAETAGFGVLSWIALLLFTGAMGKSAQFPLHIWLPDAMEGPTPVSALIHAATMVTAGVYLVARSAALYELTPHVTAIIAALGAFTAIFAASIALVQNDIKRVLAYSTVSQLGYMFLALGVGAYGAAVFHLFTHAFFKALLFLGSGSVIHAMSGQQDMRRMGGLAAKIPVTYRTMLVATLAIAGIPGLAGFFSKDEILWKTVSGARGGTALYVVGLVTAAMTAFYMWRLLALTFYGEPRIRPDIAAKVHESPLSMTGPLMVLAAGSAVVGWLGVSESWGWGGFFQAFWHWVEPAFPHAEAAEGHVSEMLITLASVAAGLLGIAVAHYLCLKNRPAAEQLEERFDPLHRALSNRWYVDELLHAIFIRGLVKGVGGAMASIDRVIVDGAVNGAGALVRGSSAASGWWDRWIVDGAVRFTAFLVRVASFPVRLAQTGLVQNYLLAVAAGAALFFGYLLAR